MNQFVWQEDVDRRVFAAVRFVNAVDRTMISGPLQVMAAPMVGPGPPDPNGFLPVRILRNRQGLHVIHSGTTPFQATTARELSDYVGQFDPAPTAPPLESVTARLRVIDPTGNYLPADFSIALPRLPAGRDAQHSVAAPMEVVMFPSPAAPVSDAWAVLRVMVWRIVPAPTAADPNATRALPVPGALVRVLRHKPNTALTALELLGRGLTEWRARADGSPATCAEALVAVRDILVTTWSPDVHGPVFNDVQAVRLEVRFDPGFNPALPDALPDLDALENSAPGVIHDALPAPLNVRARDRISRHVAFDKNNHLIEFQPT